MAFRRSLNSQDWWRDLVRQNRVLLDELPRRATANEQTFRDYLTSGTARGIPLSPSVFELSPRALNDLWTFVHDKAHFDFDASLFDDFDAAFRRLRSSSWGDSRPAK